MFSALAVSVFGVAAAGLAVALAWAVLHNMQRGESLRRDVLQRLEGIPLRRALAAFGVDPMTYLYSERLVDIERHMRACSACPHGQHCTRQFQRGAGDELTSCPNYQELCSCQRRYGTATAA